MHISGSFSYLLEIYKPVPSQATCDDHSRVRVRDAAATRDFRRLRSHFQLRPAAFHVNGGVIDGLLQQKRSNKQPPKTDSAIICALVSVSRT